MRALLLTVGSRGDAEPFCSLASSLATGGHDVDLFLQTDLQHLAPPRNNSNNNRSIHIHSLPFTQLDFYKYVGNPSHGKGHSNPRVEFVGVVTDIIAELVLPCTRDILSSVVVSSEKNNNHKQQQQPTVIIASSLARPLAIAIGEAAAALGSRGQQEVPVCLIQLQPLVPTRDFPHYSQTEQSVEAIMNLSSSSSSSSSSTNNDADDDSHEQNEQQNLESYLELERFQHEFLQERLDALYKSLDIMVVAAPPKSFETDMKPALLGQHDKIVLVNAFSNQLIPTCSDHTALPNIVNDVGPLADSYIPRDWTPPDDLVSFLESCGGNHDAPVCVGFGSMPFDKVMLIVEALKRMNRRAVLVGHVMEKAVVLDDECNNNNMIFIVKSVPYAWLLPKCCVMLSHGGAGVVHATLRAGIPSIISPLMGDQFFWAALLQAKGLGVQCGKNLMSDATVNDVVESIDKALKCQDACREIGTKIRTLEGVGGSGADRLVKILEERFDPNH